MSELFQKHCNALVDITDMETSSDDADSAVDHIFKTSKLSSSCNVFNGQLCNSESGLCLLQH